MQIEKKKKKKLEIWSAAEKGSHQMSWRATWTQNWHPDQEQPVLTQPAKQTSAAYPDRLKRGYQWL